VQVTRISDTPPEELWVPLRRARLSRLLGATVPDAEVQGVLASISDRVEETAEGWSVRRPSHRFDIRIEADLIEEVARLRGFERIAEEHALAPQIAGPAPEARVTNERILTAVADRGYREVITYTFVDPALQRQLFPDAHALALANALSPELSEMRVSLWPGLLQACRDNMRRQQKRVRLFELGKKFLLEGSAQQGALREIEALAGVATGARLPEQWGSGSEPTDFFDVKADLLEVLALAGDAAQIHFEPDALSCLHPGRSARIYRGMVPIGWLGELHPQIITACHSQFYGKMLLLARRAYYASSGYSISIEARA
jgi:phenylalanyl-tRNA synthetase beta chain